MTEAEQLFKQALNKGKKPEGKFVLITGTVKAIEGDTCTVDHYETVSLNAIIDNLDSQFTIYPKLNSKVVIARIENEDDMFIVSVSEIEKVTIKMGDQLFEMKDGKFTIKSSSLDLKSILSDGFQQLVNASIITPSGPGTFSPADILNFSLLQQKVNQLLS